ncbi:hypothetical protein KC343_g3039 [Hortaea werneckii]|nr:hypothetical protein KC323_g6993 [Hortaea werneckii]KAI6858742.1 hypothetical protein KC338_g7586 [Hortaea werneckii]KAI7352947.1 hypothetical protein KC320_g4221 [Hortaea werneckii]KAI7562657.1 hypothetical protein KC317_g8264 [Hortaea werneckii]KAI7633243.1 hypothetical protein KC343_g3039 [Hortaea werneckii]
MPSPIRRSTRGAPPAKPTPTTNSSSSSSLATSKQLDASAKTTSNGHNKSASPPSPASDEMSEPPRRSQRSHPTQHDEATQDDDNIQEGNAEEEDVTRCICGQQEYPGPPLSEAFNNVDLQNDDAGGLFIQCDGCSVWQHGGCVGIVEESLCPEKYYCEECRPKLHDQHTDERGAAAANAQKAIDKSNRQQYSIYLPVNPQTKRKGSVSKSDDKTKKERDAAAMRASADPATGRRRGTMRSKEHDDEEEQLRRALEESRREQEGSGNGRRNGKRARDESEDVKHDSKRQRILAESLAALSRNATIEDDSEEETPSGSRGKKARADAQQTARQAELREKEKEREKQRAEAAGRRQERAGRRRGDEPDPEETPKLSASAKTSPPPSSLPPSPPPQTTVERAPPKRGPGKKTKKLGNNQYTKARERDLAAQAAASSPHHRKRALNNNGGSSGDEQLPNGDSNEPQTGKGKGKGKNKVANGHASAQEPKELTVQEMERVIDRMSLYMQQKQIEMAGDHTPPTADAGVPGMPGGAVQPPTSVATGDDERPFDELNSMEQADHIQRSIMKWKALFGAHPA